MFETCFSCDKDMWFAATDYYMHFYIIVLFPLATPINNFYSFIVFSLLINAVILLLNSLVLLLDGIHRIASEGYYGFRFVTPTQCVERFHRYGSNEKIL